MAQRSAVAISREIAQLKNAPISKEAKEELIAELVAELEAMARDAKRARDAQADLLKKGAK